MRTASIAVAIVLANQFCLVLLASEEAGQDQRLPGREVQQLIARREFAKAGRLLATQHSAAKKAFDAASTEGAIVTLAAVLGDRADLAEQVSPEKAGEARQEHLRFLAEQVTSHPGSAAIVSAYAEANVAALSRLVQQNAEKAEQQLASIEKYLAFLQEQDSRVRSAIEPANQAIEWLKTEIDAAKTHQSLIGRRAFPLEAEAWVNGEPLSSEDLRGKIVLLDFWAAYCEPCIATFPHLRQWRGKYAAKGLVIVGLTNYCGFDWDEKAARSQLVENLSPSDEQEALARFAEHHQLKHHFAIVAKQSRMLEQYGVAMIPQTVLIDREGRICMIRVGGDEDSFRELEEAIQKLIAAESTEASE